MSNLVISSVLTALGVPGGTAAKTFDEAYRDDVSKSMWNMKHTVSENRRSFSPKLTYNKMTHVVNVI